MCTRGTRQSLASKKKKGTDEGTSCSRRRRRRTAGTSSRRETGNGRRGRGRVRRAVPLRCRGWDLTPSCRTSRARRDGRRPARQGPRTPRGAAPLLRRMPYCRPRWAPWPPSGICAGVKNRPGERCVCVKSEETGEVCVREEIRRDSMWCEGKPHHRSKPSAPRPIRDGDFVFLRLMVLLRVV